MLRNTKLPVLTNFLFIGNSKIFVYNISNLLFDLDNLIHVHTSKPKNKVIYQKEHCPFIIYSTSYQLTL